MRFLGIVLIMFLATPVSANSIYMSRCASCHGGNGQGVAGYSPKLAGQHWQYLRDQMRDIKKGTRTNGQSGMMKGMFQQLSKEEIEALAKYLEKLK